MFGLPPGVRIYFATELADMRKGIDGLRAIVEGALRHEAIGRKSWLFVGSDDGGAVNATFTSLLASAQLCDVEPWAYLRDSFCLLPSWPAHELLELAPLKWKQTALRNDVRARLDANRFRRLTLDARD
jgi:transposase